MSDEESVTVIQQHEDDNDDNDAPVKSNSSMRVQIIKYMFFLVVLMMLLTYVADGVILYMDLQQKTRERLAQETRIVAAYVEATGVSSIDTIDQLESDENVRITLISSGGEVLYDTEQDEYTFQNHLDRPEVQEAKKNGEGTDVRRSDTISKDMFYYAKLLSDGSILRLSKPVDSVFYTFLSLLPPLAVITAIMLVAAYLLSRRTSDHLVRPINTLDLDKPLENNTYEELTPLLKSINRNNKEKEAMANMRKEFSANVTHELKTPLTSISGYAEIMRDGIVRTEDIPKFSGRIYNEARRLVTLIDDTIALSRLDEGQISEQREAIDLYEETRQVCSRLASKAASCKVHLTMSGEHCSVMGIHQLISEMIYNITDNAVKYNKEGGFVNVWVGTVPGGDKKVIVTDNGIGIPKEDQERIFERFYRVDKSHSKEIGGTGLGLSIVKHSAILLGAKINVDSKVGKGTKMEIVFPASAAEPVH